jgi:predicted nucleotidyltransferase
VIKARNTLTFEEIRERLTPLLSDVKLQFALLFGSSAQGRMHTRSDIDLAFMFESPTDILELTTRVIRLLHTDTVDVVDLRRASPLLRYAAVKTGRLLYEKTPGLFHTFCSLAFRMYADTKKLRDARAEATGYFLEKRKTA